MKLIDWAQGTFDRLNLKNKIFFANLVVIVLLSLIIALFTRWVLISNLTNELKIRGLGIAKGLAQTSREFVVSGDMARLTRHILQAAKGHREYLIAYVVVQDQNRNILAHTFTGKVPNGIQNTEAYPPDLDHRLKRIRFGNATVYDVTVPIKDNALLLGTVHVGLKKEFIDGLIAELRLFFLSFLSATAILFFWISHRLSKSITRPIYQLTRIADDIARGESGHDRAEKTGGDEVVQLARSFDNMTRRLEASQQDLKASEEKYRCLFDCSPNPLFVLERDTLTILDTCPSTTATYGYTREELLGTAFTFLGELDVTPGQTRTGFILEKVRHYKKDGGRIFVKIKASPAPYTGGEVLLTAVTDITDMVEKDAQLVQAGKMSTLGQLSAGIAHELNQPLNAIRLGNEFLTTMIEMGREIPPNDLNQVAREVTGQVDRAAEIIDRLRTFGRKSDFETEALDLNTIVRMVYNMLSLQLNVDNIRIQLELAPDLPRIMGHKNRLEQVFINLVTNARDAVNQARENPKAAPPAWPDQADTFDIRMRTFQEKGLAKVSVSDTGAGIPQGMIEHIFDPFFTTKQAGKGMGLGLSIIYGIIRDHGGEITVESREGCGTSFVCTFPEATQN